jgi:hypothetical protein
MITHQMRLERRVVSGLVEHVAKCADCPFESKPRGSQSEAKAEWLRAHS